MNFDALVLYDFNKYIELAGRGKQAQPEESKRAAKPVNTYFKTP